MLTKKAKDISPCVLDWHRDGILGQRQLMCLERELVTPLEEMASA